METWVGKNLHPMPKQLAQQPERVRTERLSRRLITERGQGCLHALLVKAVHRATHGDRTGLLTVHDDRRDCVVVYTGNSDSID